MSGPELGARVRSAAVVLVVALTAGGCATPYIGAGSPNLHVKTTTGDRTIFAATSAAIEVERVTPGCQGVSEGKVYLANLGRTADSLHLPAGRLSNLVFSFRTSSLWGQWESTTKYAMLIRPREGFTYEATVAYADGLYSVDIFEVAPNGGPGRKLARQGIAGCQRV